MQTRRIADTAERASRNIRAHQWRQVGGAGAAEKEWRDPREPAKRRRLGLEQPGIEGDEHDRGRSVQGGAGHIALVSRTRSVLGRTHDPQDHRAWGPPSGFYDERRLVILELLGRLDHDYERRGPGARQPQYARELVGLP
jgi:hypothetical protein